MEQERLFSDAYQEAVKKIQRNAEKIGAAFPQVAVGELGVYNREHPDYWTGGFWGGLVWLAYREIRDPRLFELACEIEEAQDEPLNQFVRLHHDVGFMWLPTAVFHYRMTGCEASRVRGLKAASILAARFNLNGRFIRAWNDTEEENRNGLAIVDCMMNLPLLFWAGKEQNDPRYEQIACGHADTVLRYFVRENFTVPHIMKFDAGTGTCLGPAWGQGKNLDSVWSRGQAWAIYGFAAAYRETGRKEYLEVARKMAERFFTHLPKDCVPYWDFCSDEKDRHARDSSAACVAASGILEIAALVSDKAERLRFAGWAEEILRHIIAEYACFDDSTQGIVRKGTVNYMSNRYINVPIIYGDFYFVEALGKLAGLPGVF